MRVLVTGGAGFVGSHVAEALLATNHDVAVVDDLSRGRRENVPEGASFYEADVRSGCEEIFKEFAPEVVCHQAAQVDVRRSVAEPVVDLEINAGGTVRLLESCVRYRAERFVLASTGGAIYGDQREFPASEDHPEYPISPYGVSKLAAERYLHFFEAQYGLPYVALRYANVYGPRQDPHGEAGVVAIFASRLAAGETCTINGTGDQTRDYVHVGDVARANALALGDGVPGGIPSGAYNVGTGIETSVIELYEIMAELSGHDSPAQHGPAKPGEQPRSAVDPTKANRVFRWRPEVGLREGIEETLRFFGAP
jgi:UDP-glucose 4-epimerase